jgi:glycosyltransferase involved in cell wall biosynthesis/2-polyprenyl-3-methyl-5-hydroxy-6-metoxy-1,4-benzoquinol methylase
MDFPKRNIAIFCDHTSGTGGGEKYFLSLAIAIASRYLVDLYVRDKKFFPDVSQFNQSLGLDLDSPNIRFRVLAPSTRFEEYDLFINASHFSILPPKGKRNLLVIFFPQYGIVQYAAQYDMVATISTYCQKWLWIRWGLTSHLLHPWGSYSHGADIYSKKNLILSTGRFFRAEEGNNKNQHLLIHAFRKLVEQGVKGWRLVLAGSPDPNYHEYVNALKEQAKDLPVDFIFNPTYEALTYLYRQAKLYWHGAGFDENGGINVAPSSAEHFGIVLVEAMSLGVVPIAPKLGGPVDIINDNLCGFLVERVACLIEKSFLLINDDVLLQNMSCKAIERSKSFSQNIFNEKVHQLLEMVLDPDLLQRGISLLRRGGKVEEVESTLMSAAEHGQSNITAFIELGKLYFMVGQRDKMLSAWEQAQQVNPTESITPVLKELCGRVRLQYEIKAKIISGEIFSYHYFENGKKSGLSDYENYDAVGWAERHSNIIYKAFRPRTCLEVGCAKGDLVQMLREKGANCKGVDISDYTINAAGETVRPHLSVSNMRPLLFQSASMDVVIGIEVMEHIPEEHVNETLLEIRRVCNGCVFMTIANTTASTPCDFFRDLSHATMKPLSWWKNKLNESGFIVVDAELPLAEFMGHQIMGRVLGADLSYLGEELVAAIHSDLVNKAKGLLARNEISDVTTYVNQSLKGLPPNMTSEYYLINLYFKSNKFADARERLERVVSLFPDDLSAKELLR